MFTRSICHLQLSIYGGTAAVTKLDYSISQEQLQMMMMIVNLCSALRKMPLLRYVFRYAVRSSVFSADL